MREGCFPVDAAAVRRNERCRPHHALPARRRRWHRSARSARTVASAHRYLAGERLARAAGLAVWRVFEMSIPLFWNHPGFQGNLSAPVTRTHTIP